MDPTLEALNAIHEAAFAEREPEVVSATSEVTDPSLAAAQLTLYERNLKWHKDLQQGKTVETTVATETEPARYDRVPREHKVARVAGAVALKSLKGIKHTGNAYIKIGSRLSLKGQIAYAAISTTAAAYYTDELLHYLF